MIRPARPARFLAALAAAALLFAVLAPSVARAYGLGDRNFIELCTTRGIERIPLDGGSPLAGHAPGLLDHCPCCVGAVVAIPPGTPPTCPVPLDRANGAWPQTRVADLAAAARIRAHPSRAPPA